MVVNCSQCGKPKGTVNRWWFGWAERDGQRFCVIPWEIDPQLVHESSVQRLCGQGCVTKALSEWMGRTQ